MKKINILKHITYNKKTESIEYTNMNFQFQEINSIKWNKAIIRKEDQIIVWYYEINNVDEIIHDQCSIHYGWIPTRGCNFSECSNTKQKSLAGGCLEGSTLIPRLHISNKWVTILCKVEGILWFSFHAMISAWIW